MFSDSHRGQRLYEARIHGENMGLAAAARQRAFEATGDPNATETIAGTFVVIAAVRGVDVQDVIEQAADQAAQEQGPETAA